MSSSANRRNKTPPGIHSITVGGFKSLVDEQTIEVRPLTLLAGANSSGKSSIMQPLLLLKQTIEAPYDPGPLLLDGPNVKFTDPRQMFARTSVRKAANNFSVAVTISRAESVKLNYAKHNHTGVALTGMLKTEAGESIYLAPEMTGTEIAPSSPIMRDYAKVVAESPLRASEVAPRWNIRRSRCFLYAEVSYEYSPEHKMSFGGKFSPDRIASYIRDLIHVPGLRGNPERTYKTTAVGENFPGTFDNYVASIISHWQEQQASKLEEVSRSLQELGLAGTVKAKQIDYTQVELRVARLIRGKNSKTTDTVSIADVGFGVSQTLPVLVALLAARRGQLVYIEQPEIHLHPRAQTALAPILVRAAERGVRVVVETHSALLLRAIQTLVAKGELAPDLVKLHWFHRSEKGATEITSADLDENGAFGQWPEDFDEVLLQTEADYLDAVTLKS